MIHQYGSSQMISPVRWCIDSLTGFVDPTCFVFSSPPTRNAYSRITIIPSSWRRPITEMIFRTNVYVAFGNASTAKGPHPWSEQSTSRICLLLELACQRKKDLYKSHSKMLHRCKMFQTRTRYDAWTIRSLMKRMAPFGVFRKLKTHTCVPQSRQKNSVARC